MIVAESISTLTPQMIYKVKRVSNDSQKTMKETKGEVIFLGVRVIRSVYVCEQVVT